MASFLALAGQSVLVVGAGGRTGSQAVQEFLDHGCSVTAIDLPPPEPASFGAASGLRVVRADPADKDLVRAAIDSASQSFGLANVLVVVTADLDVKNRKSTEDDDDDVPKPIWETSWANWETGSATGPHTAFIAIQQFLQAAQRSKQRLSHGLAIVVVGWQGDDLLDSLIRRVKRDIVRWDGHARINAVLLPGRDRRCDLPPDEITRTVAFLASHRAARCISGQLLPVGDISASPTASSRMIDTASLLPAVPPPSHAQRLSPRIRVVLTIDFDAVSGWLGTGSHPDNVLADYSAGFFAAQVGARRLLDLLKRQGIAERCTWFIPGHSAESFENEVKEVIESGAEIGLHGYAHEGAYQLTPEQEREVLEKCIEICKRLTGRKPAGYRAPLYQVRESTLDLLEEYGFEYDSSLTDRDCHPFWAPRRPPIHRIDFSKPASSWMHPIVQDPDSARRPLVEIPCNWYMEDMTPMQFLPHTPNSHGYVDVRTIERMWKDRFLWILEHETNPIFPLILHPDTSGMAHVIGTVERMISWLQSWGDVVSFCRAGEVATQFRAEESGH